MLPSDRSQFQLSSRIWLSLLILLPTAASAQNLVVNEYFDNKALEYDHNGTFVRQFAAGGTVRFYGSVFDSSGNFYVAGNQGGNIRKFSPTGVDLGNFATGLGAPENMVIDSSGNLLVSEYFNDKVHRFSLTGADLGTFISGVGSPDGIALDSSGNVYVASFSDGTVRRYGSSGNYIGQFATGLSAIESLAIDKSGDLFATERGTHGAQRHDVREYSPTGTYLGSFGSSVLVDPAGIAFDDSGALYVSDLGGGVVQRFSNAGVFQGTFLSGLSSPLGLAFRPAAVPEPMSCFALLTGLATFGGLRKRSASRNRN